MTVCTADPIDVRCDVTHDTRGQDAKLKFGKLEVETVLLTTGITNEEGSGEDAGTRVGESSDVADAVEVWK